MKNAFYKIFFTTLILILASTDIFSEPSFKRSKTKYWSVQPFVSRKSFTGDMKDYYDPAFGFGLQLEKRFGGKTFRYGYLSYTSFNPRSNYERGYANIDMYNITLSGGIGYYLYTDNVRQEVAPYIGIETAYNFFFEKVTYISEFTNEVGMVNEQTFGAILLAPMAGVSIPVNDFLTVSFSASYQLNLFNLSNYSSSISYYNAFTMNLGAALLL